jgi:hypothetical protein
MGTEERRLNTHAASVKTEPARLSQSSIWALQRDYFEGAGNAAWRANAVPSYVTVNPFIAATYVELVRAFAMGHAKVGAPIDVIELGAGSGRFAHHFLDQYFHDESGNPADAPAIRYVMTDVSRANIAFWRTHERFKPFIADGRLDMTMFDVEADIEQAPELRRCLAGPAPHSGARPLVVIANYVFDSLPQDLFRMAGGHLQQGLATIGDEASPGTAEERIKRLRLDYTWQECPPDLYDERGWNVILRHYLEALPDGAFLMPVGALACLERVRVLAAGAPLLVLVCDRGHTNLSDHAGADAPQPSRHGSFSFPVNFHALDAWTLDAGGLVLRPTYPHASIAVAVLGFDLADGQATALSHTYRREVQRFGPDDFFMLKQAADDLVDSMTLSQVLALLRLSGWDRTVFLRAYDRLVELLPEAGSREREGLAAGLKTLWRRHLDLGEEHDLGFQVGSLLGGLGHPHAAIAPLEFSIAHHGADPATLRNLETCRSACADRG